MSCFSCFSLNEKRLARRSDKNNNNNNNRRVDQLPGHASVPHKESTRPENPKTKNPAANDTTNRGRKSKSNNTNDENIAAQTFTFRELATATKNFRKDCLIGEGGFGRVYKGKLDRSGQVVAVKQLDQNGMQGHKEFLVEVLMLSLLHDEHLVNLIGYCADGEQRLLVYEYMPLGSLEGHLLERQPGQKPLDWNTRMKIALGAARGLEYLHDKANPPVIYRDLKSSNILLDSEFNAKLSDFGLAKLGPVGDKTHVSSRIMGTYGYCAPEYQRTGHLTVKSDVYSYGVVLLEIITGRRAVDTTKTGKKQYLVNWAQPIFKDPNRIAELADPLLQGTFPTRGLHQAVAVASMCLNDAPASRPSISDVVSALSFLGGSAEKGNAKDPALPDDYAMARGGDGINASEREVAESAGRGSTSRRPAAQQENSSKMTTM